MLLFKQGRLIFIALPNTPAMKQTFIACTLLLLVVMGATAQTTTAKTTFPKPNGWVNDFENDLDLSTIAYLKKQIEAHKAKTTDQIAVITIKSYSPYTTLGEYAKDIANNWGVGVKGKDNGITMVFCEAKQEVWIAVGKGLETKLTNAQCKKIVDETMLPKFKEGNYDRGLMDGVNEVIKVLEAP